MAFAISTAAQAEISRRQRSAFAERKRMQSDAQKICPEEPTR
jgi:hypothetical protein